MPNIIWTIFILTLLPLSLTSCFRLSSSELIFIDHTIPIQEEIVPDVVTFAYLKKKVLTPYCISCHKEMGDETEIMWWIVPGSAEKSDLFFWMEEGSMPPERAATTRELEIVRRYIEQMVDTSRH